MQNVGIENLKTIILFGLIIGQKGYKALEDGKLELVETLDLLGETRKVPEVLEAIKRAPEELANLDMEEQQQIYSKVQAEFDLPNDKLEAAIEIGLRVTLNVVSSVYEVRELFKAA